MDVASCGVHPAQDGVPARGGGSLQAWWPRATVGLTCGTSVDLQLASVLAALLDLSREVTPPIYPPGQAGAGGLVQEVRTLIVRMVLDRGSESVRSRWTWRPVASSGVQWRPPCSRRCTSAWRWLSASLVAESESGSDVWHVCGSPARECSRRPIRPIA